MDDPVVPLERNLYGHPLAGLLWERQFEKILLKHGWEKVPNWECLFVHHQKGLGELKSFRTLRIFVFLRDFMIWKVMRRNVWNDIVSLQTSRLNNSTKYLLPASMTTTVK